MKGAGIFICMALFGGVNMTQCYPCLPTDVTEDSVVSASMERSASGALVTKQITVKQTLDRIKAKCLKGKLVDGDGRPVRFYKLQGCWGNPPQGYLEILEKQTKEIESLRRDNTVIEMTCNPSGMPRQSIL